MADFHRPYQSDLRPPPSSAPDPTFLNGNGNGNGNGYFSSATPHANGYFSSSSSAPKSGAFPGVDDRRIEIYTSAPPNLPPPPRLALPPPPGRREGGVGSGGSSGGGGAGGGGGGASMWCFSDPELKRRRRVASYKAYSVEGKVKSSLRRGLRWFKGKCSDIFHGW